MRVSKRQMKIAIASRPMDGSWIDPRRTGHGRPQRRQPVLTVLLSLVRGTY